MEVATEIAKFLECGHLSPLSVCGDLSPRSGDDVFQSRRLRQSQEPNRRQVGALQKQLLVDIDHHDA